MRAFQGRQYPLTFGQQPEGVERLVVFCRDVFCPAGIFQQTMFRPNSRIIQPRTYRFGIMNLAFLVLQQIDLCTVQDTNPPGYECRSVPATAQAPAAGFNTN